MKVTSETLKIAKEKGFKCDHELKPPTIHSDGSKSFSLATHIGKEITPTQSDIQKWLREKHKIHIELQFSRNSAYNGGLEWWFYLYPHLNIGSRTKFFPYEIGENLSYEEALEVGLLEALKLIK